MRYARQIAMPEIGDEGQKRLQQAKVLIVGVGGLGTPIALYLTAAGIGTIGLIDADVVSLTNLQRQVLYTEQEIERPKTIQAKARLQQLNSTLQINTYQERLTTANAEQLIAQYDIVVDGCDNFATRYIINDVCKKLKKPFVHGAISATYGEVVVFTYQNNIDYSTLYPERDAYCALNTSGAPVIGTTPAVIGSIEATQVLQLICGYGEPLIDTLLSVDLNTMAFNKIKL